MSVFKLSGENVWVHVYENLNQIEFDVPSLSKVIIKIGSHFVVFNESEGVLDALLRELNKGCTI